MDMGIVNAGNELEVYERNEAITLKELVERNVLLNRRPAATERLCELSRRKAQGRGTRGHRKEKSRRNGRHGTV